METFKFETSIKKSEDMDACYIEIPHEVCVKFKSGRVLVNASFNGELYNGQAMRMGTPCHIIGIPKTIRTKINKQPGDVIHVTLTESGRNIAKPIRRAEKKPSDALKTILMQNGQLENFNVRPRYQRTDYITWIENAKREDTKEKRIAQMIEELQNGDTYMGMVYKAKK